jgi:C1A family cysteine protease
VFRSRMTHHLYRLLSFHSSRSFDFRSIAPQRLLAGAASALTALILFASYSAQSRAQEAANTPLMAPISPRFTEYQNDLERQSVIFGEAPVRFNAAGYPLGHIPVPVDLPHLTAQPGLAAQMGVESSLPSSYDLRTLGRVSPVKNQLKCGDCWAFATYGSMESVQLASGESWNFSENNLNTQSGFDYGICGGGNGLMSTAYLARWSGPINASADPDPTSTSCTSTSNCYNPSPSGLPAQKHVQSVYFIAARANSSDNTNLKAAIQTYGGVDVSISADELGGNNPYWNSSTSSYYYNGATVCLNSSNVAIECPVDHDVTLIGWDDNYAATNFTTAPPGNGAFIVKNSWGTGFGSSGFFFVSYYDVSRATDTSYVFYDNESTSNYNIEYQYDPLGYVSSYGYGSWGITTTWGASIFTASSTGQLAAVATYALANSTTYTISIYTGVTPGSPTSGTLATTNSGTMNLAGYTTIVLPTPVSLTNGEKFSVVIALSTPGWNYPVPVQVARSGYSSQATASAGQTFISSNGTTWTDFTTVSSSNPDIAASIKAFETAQQSAVTVSSLGVSPSAIASGGSATLTITLSAAAPTGGAVVLLSSSNSTAFPVPSTYIVPAGQSSASFTDQAGTVSSATQVTVTAIYDGSTQQAQVTVNVAPGFTLSASPASVSVAQGSSATSTITVADVGGFASNVTLAASGLPSGVTASFAAGSGAGTQVLTLAASTSAAVTSTPLTVTITGTSGTLTATTSIALTVTAQPSFTAGAGGTTAISISRGSTGTGTISVVGTNGFAGTVSLSCQVATTMTGAKDMPTCSLNPTSVAISGASAVTSTLTVNTTGATSAANGTKKLYWPSAGGAALALVLFFVLPKRRLNWLALVGLLAFIASIGTLGCNPGGGGGGGGNSGTTPGTYTIAVSGTSGSISATVGTITLTVQ